MVYRGKPSKACKTCRQRRIKCDLKTDGCSPCARAGKQCPLYRSDLDTMFCDQTEHTAKKVTLKARKESGEEVPALSTVSQRGHSRIISTTLVFSEQFTVPRPDDFALSYAYAHHIVQRSTGTNAGISTPHTGVLACIRALGMASYSVSCRSANATTQARRYYVRAIRSLNVNLTDPDTSKQDCTLLSVVALSYFETVLGTDQPSMKAWISHVNGTARLLELRGPDQVHTANGRILFMQATSILMAQSLMLGQRLPPHLHTYFAEAKQYLVGVPDVLWKEHGAMMELTDFYSDAVSGRLLDPSYIIATATAIDTKLKAAFIDAPRKWTYIVEDCSPDTLTSYIDFTNRLHVYQTSWSAQIHNSGRNGRILCHATVLGLLRRLTALHVQLPGAEALAERAHSIIKELSLDILASVPQHLGLIKPEIATPKGGFAIGGTMEVTAPSSLIDYDNATIPVLRTTTGYQLVHAVSLVGKVAHEASMRGAACSALREIGRRLGMKQALFLAGAIERDEPSAQDTTR
ncbi:hypothetical protein BAUCODRAFT_120118 [Baudoinia panamericana UAMH 10762]|uniref:Zn(2)-C6 fungal-type domain-containing protein n=1 Tax=Baudoinia panamericana (strain UAMH 10762) TaxID=717646 RepID=M2MPX4_BAUPA|nr:uncharacterized protein BAUCODRAFT_120118 [Baudoinia panamericana UAMH 10762]EMC98821.1 hypothetical protein BAUCODRAFT_120118 [Baudoinia panamericana UAMH 10762]